MTHLATAFSDPNCPFCFATEERLARLGLEHRVRWCGVQHAPQLPVPMLPASDALARELAHEVRTVRSIAPEIEIAIPPGKPGTEQAIRFGAAALRTDPVAGRRFVRSLYRAFWTQGVDLSDLTILDRLAAEAGLDALRPEDADIATSDGWQRAWERTGLGGVPLLVRDDGQLLYGLVDADQLRAFLDPAATEQSPD